MENVKFFNVKFIGSYGFSSQLPTSNRKEIVFSGRSNVGKSSLINKLVNRKALARTSSAPGKTATINFYGVDEIMFVDLPGYGYAKVSKSEKKRWAELIEGYFTSDRIINLVVQLIDIRHSPSVKDLEMINYMIDLEIPFIIVFTKLDKLNKSELEDRRKGFKNQIPFYDQIEKVEVSNTNGQGIEQLRSIISEAVF